MTETQINEMLSKSRSNNERAGITGILIFYEGIFTQFMEGPAQQIDRLYEKIKKDSRHHRLIELFSGDAIDRFYPDWSMSYKAVDQEKALEIVGYKEFDTEAFFQPKTANVFHPGIALLSNFISGLHLPFEQSA